MRLMKRSIIVIWMSLISLHVFCILVMPVVLPDVPPVFAFVIYATVLVLSNTGLPLLVDPYSGWGWSSPNAFGWLLSAVVWVGIYYVLAFIVWFLFLSRREE